MSAVLFTVLIGLVALERVAELVVARRNGRWAAEHGGVEHGASHYPVMVLLHTGFLAAAVAEVWLLHRPFVAALGWTALVVVLLAQALRWWCIRTLGPRWNTRVVVVPGMPLVEGGPYRLTRHPNYVAVVLEGIALPLVHTAWLTALAFTVLNAGLLTVRIRVEESALASASAPAPVRTEPT